MKYFFLFLISGLVCFSCKTDKDNIEDVEIVEVEPKYTFTSFEQKISYCIGLDHGTSSALHLSSSNLAGKFSPTEVQKGMIDYLKGDELRIMPYEIDSVLNLYLVEDGSVDSSVVSAANGSYAYGINEGNVLVASLVSRGIDQKVVVDLLVAGIEDGMENNPPSVSLKEARIEVVAYYSDINKEMGENFLAQNAERENIQTTQSGLQYEIFTIGEGVKPNLTDTVIVHYTGRFVDGREFYSSIPSRIAERKVPINEMPGWSEGLQLMNEGGQYRFFMPHELGYGEKGAPGVEPYSALVYDVELLKVIKYIPNN